MEPSVLSLALLPEEREILDLLVSLTILRNTYSMANSWIGLVSLLEYSYYGKLGLIRSASGLKVIRYILGILYAR